MSWEGFRARGAPIPAPAPHIPSGADPACPGFLCLSISLEQLGVGGTRGSGAPPGASPKFKGSKVPYQELAVAKATQPPPAGPIALILAPQPSFWPHSPGLETEHPPLPGAAPLNPAGWGIAPTPCGPPPRQARSTPLALRHRVWALSRCPWLSCPGSLGGGHRGAAGLVTPPGPSVAHSWGVPPHVPAGTAARGQYMGLGGSLQHECTPSLSL